MKSRDYTALDRLIMGFERVTGGAGGDGFVDRTPAGAGMTHAGEAAHSGEVAHAGAGAHGAGVMNAEDRASGEGVTDVPPRDADKRRSAALMRVNHAGEVAAQALYAGQAATARTEQVRAAMLQAAAEEGAHLSWCQTRIRELDSHISYLTPLWYFGSFAIGALAGVAGDRWSLGFVMETERQVVQHLDKHLQLLPERDHKSREILQQMRRDELQHAGAARAAGAAELPGAVRVAMRCCAKIMTGTAYRL